MPPFVAFLIALGFIYWLFREDARERPVGSKGLWVPALFLLILSTRPVAYWFGATTNRYGDDSDAGPGGSTADLAVLGLLIFAVVRVLKNRRVQWGSFVSRNLSILALYAFFLASVLWAEYPFSVVKRVVKDFSVVLFATAILTEADPGYAIRKLFLRCSYVVFTLSALTIKYYPHIGTQATRAGDRTFTGLTTQKNSLGEVAFTYSLIIFWDLMTIMREDKLGWKHPRVVRRLLMLMFGVWLLITCDSQTSLFCLLVGTALFFATGRVLKMGRPKRILVIVSLSVLLVYGLDRMFHIKENVVQMIGRDLTFTGRTEIWEKVMEQPIDPLVGTGFLMFFDSKYGIAALEEIGARVSTAHNGYLETFLDGGIIGVALLAIMLLARGNAIMNRMVAGEPWARVAFIFLVLAMFHNLSESTFFRFSILWFFLVLAMVTAPAMAPAPADAWSKPRGVPGEPVGAS